MKKLLIIAHFWPYREGSGRVIGLAKYLPEFGWEPIVLTAPLNEKPDQFRIIEIPYKDVIGSLKKKFHLRPDRGFQEQIGIPLVIREAKNSFINKLITFIEGFITYPDRYKGWKPFALEGASKFLHKENIGAMISIWPVASHIIAKELKVKHKIPWIADLPDLWSQNHNYHYGRLRLFFDQRLELQTLSLADALTTVTQPWAENLKALHKRESVYAITHGFNPDTLNTAPADLTDKFTITYTGAIYRGKQDPSKLFAALKDLIIEGTINPNDIEVRFYGLKLDWLASEIEKHGLSTIARYYGAVPTEIAFEKQRESQLLLLLNWEVSWEDQREKGWCPLKIYAYLAAQRPILAIGGTGDDVVKKLLYEIKAGIYCKTVEDSKNALKELYLEYKQKGKVTYNGDIKKINKYNYREKAKQFVEILDRITQKD